jgi:hypothetical protein
VAETLCWEHYGGLYLHNNEECLVFSLYFDCDANSLTCTLSSFELPECLQCGMTGTPAMHAEGSTVTVAEVMVLSLGFVCFNFWYHYTLHAGI